MNTRKKLLLTVLLVALGGMYASAQISYNDFMALKPKEKVFIFADDESREYTLKLCEELIHEEIATQASFSPPLEAFSSPKTYFCIIFSVKTFFCIS